jgi:hypothetical protein
MIHDDSLLVGKDTNSRNLNYFFRNDLPNKKVFLYLHSVFQKPNPSTANLDFKDTGNEQKNISTIEKKKKK